VIRILDTFLQGDGSFCEWAESPSFKATQFHEIGSL